MSWMSIEWGSACNHPPPLSTVANRAAAMNDGLLIAKGVGANEAMTKRSGHEDQQRTDLGSSTTCSVVYSRSSSLTFSLLVVVKAESPVVFKCTSSSTAMNAFISSFYLPPPSRYSKSSLANYSAHLLRSFQSRVVDQYLNRTSRFLFDRSVSNVRCH